MILSRDQAFITVFCLMTQTDNDPNKTSFGSGLFVSNGEENLYLVTAAHVARATNSNTKLLCSGIKGECLGLNLNELNRYNSWVFHPSADLAIMKIDKDAKPLEALKGHFYPLSHISMEPKAPSRDAELTTIGFPCGLGLQNVFSPLTFRSHAASGYVSVNNSLNNQASNIFCLENPSVGGYSGAPVFELGYMAIGSRIEIYGQQTVCHGFISATLGDQTGGKIAMVVPSYYLKELIENEKEEEVVGVA